MHEDGITTLHGVARFVSRDAMEVDGTRVSAEAIAICAGARPAELGFPGAELAVTSEGFMDLAELPERILFVGGGYIAFEFAWLAKSAGADVTIVHRSAHVLEGFDAHHADLLAEHYRRSGIRVLTGAAVERIERAGAGVRVIAAGEPVDAGLAVHAAGRVPDLEGLDLEAGGVAREKHGVTVDASLRSTTNPRVWAAGDAAATGLPLTPVASAQGRVVAAGILGERAEYRPEFAPSVVFSDPPMARVGMGAEEAAADPERFEVRAFDTGQWVTQRRVGYDTGAATVVLDRTRGTIAGAHLLGLHADELINVFALAVKAAVPTDTVREMEWAYPTAAYDINYLLRP